PEPAQHLAQRMLAGPGLGIADGDLAAIGPAGLQGRARPALDDLDFMAGARQPPSAGHPDDARAKDRNFHRWAVPIRKTPPSGRSPRAARGLRGREQPDKAWRAGFTPRLRSGPRRT